MPLPSGSRARTGVVLGTAACRSAEQARGRSLEKRTDIWSFGCLLHERPTGRQVFREETVEPVAQIQLLASWTAELPAGDAAER
jgi:eukaryotic-like serine/threonine-protein kinase